MHKKVSAELVSLAHSILQMENKDDVNELHKKAQSICEKLSVLKFVEAYVSDIPNVSESNNEDKIILDEGIKEEVVDIIKENELIIEEIVDQFEEKKDETVLEEFVNEVEEIIIDQEIIYKVEETIVDKVEEEIIVKETIVEEKELSTKEPEIVLEEQIKEITETKSELVKEEKIEMSSLQFSLEEEFKDAISADVATQLFAKATKENPIINKPVEITKRSLNDSIYSSNLQVGLNDRIAFVKHLFDGSQEDFNRVLSQLNSFKVEQEAVDFIQNFVKLDYDWSEKEEFEKRLINLIKRKFL